MTNAATDTESFPQAAPFAAELFEAFTSGQGIEPVSERDPGIGVDGAYAIQRRLIELHARSSRKPVGRKIGLTSIAMQRQLGVDSPDYGVLLDSHVFSSRSTISRTGQRLIAPKLEAELAFVLGDRLEGPGLGADDVLAATRAIVPIFEVIDSRVAGWRIKLVDTIADNASCFGAVLGDEMTATELGDLAAIEMQLSRDGEVAETGRGEAVMGDPALAVAWLANELSRFGDALEPGHLVLSGSFTAAVEATPGVYRADFGAPLSSVEVTIEP